MVNRTFILVKNVQNGNLQQQRQCRGSYLVAKKLEQKLVSTSFCTESCYNESDHVGEYIKHSKTTRCVKSRVSRHLGVEVRFEFHIFYSFD